MPTEGSKDALSETKRLVLYAVVNKLYDQISSELGEEFDDSGFDMRRTIVTFMTTFHRRRVMFMKKGAKCGGAKERPIDKDIIFLYEKKLFQKHILRQLHHKQFIRRNMGRVDEILGSEEESAEAFTLHVLQKNTDGRFSACAVTNSEQACALLNQNSFCESFKPLGSMTRASSDDKDMGSEGGPPQKGQGPGGPPTGPENSGSGPLSTGAQATTGGRPSNGGTGTAVQPGDKPDSGTGNDGSSNGPGGPSQGSDQTPGSTPKGTDTPGSKETSSQSATPTPVNASPTPTPQANGSSRDCEGR